VGDATVGGEALVVATAPPSAWISIAVFAGQTLHAVATLDVADLTHRVPVTIRVVNATGRRKTDISGSTLRSVGVAYTVRFGQALHAIATLEVAHFAVGIAATIARSGA